MPEVEAPRTAFKPDSSQIWTLRMPTPRTPWQFFPLYRRKTKSSTDSGKDVCIQHKGISLMYARGKNPIVLMSANDLQPTGADKNPLYSSTGYRVYVEAERR